MTYPKALRQTNAQLTVIPVPSPVPSIGGLVGSGNTYTPEFYGQTIIRATDVNTDPENTMWHSWEVGDNGGSNDGIWNSNHRLLRIIAAGTGTTRIIGFDGAKCTIANPFSEISRGSVWDKFDPNVDYSLSGTVITRRIFNYLDPLSAPTMEFVFDFRTSPGLSQMGAVTWRSQLSIFGNTLVAGFSDRGTQGTGQYVATYNLVTGESQVWNTLTGSITGLGKVEKFFPFTIHDVIAYSGGIAQVSVGNTCVSCPDKHGPFLWDIGTLLVKLITVEAGGHNTMGYRRYVNVLSAPKMAWRGYGDIKSVTEISSNENCHLPSPQDMHLAWQNVDPQDSFPIFATQVSTNLPQPMQIVSPLQNELWAVDPHAHDFLRIAPTMTSGIANKFNFRTQFAIMGMSPDGFAAAWSSDWMGTLGNCDGVSPTGTLGADKPNACRSDVFIVVPQ